MRSIIINRPKRMEASMSSLIVEIDGVKVGKLGNGKVFSTKVDEQSHELHIHGGALAGKAFASKLKIPAGGFSYSFQVEMLTISGGTANYKPVLRPCGEAALNSTTRTVLLMGISLTIALLDEGLRDILKKLSNATLRLELSETEWRLDLCVEGQRKTVLTQPYSQQKGSLLAAVSNAIEHSGLHSPEDRTAFVDKLFDEWLNYLPDYRRVGPNELAFAG